MATVPNTPADASAKATIDATLAQYGLSSLADWAWQQYTGGASNDQIMLDMRNQPEYKVRFPAMETLAQQGHALTEGQYVSAENSYAQVMHAAGMPTGFYDQPADFANFLTNNVSPSELQQRVTDANTAIFGNPEIAHQLQGLYGAGGSPGQILAYFLDPTRAEPLIQKQVAASEVAAAGVNSGFGQISQADAEAIGVRGLGQSDLANRFQQIGVDQGVVQRGAGPTDEQGPLMSGHQLLAGALLGDANAQRQLTQIQQQKKDEQATGGGFVSSKNGTGFTGIGVDPATL